MKLKSKTTTYELTMPELKTLIANELGVSEDRVTIRFKTREVGDDRFGPTSHETYGIDVTVTGEDEPAPDSNAEAHRHYNH